MRSPGHLKVPRFHLRVGGRIPSLARIAWAAVCWGCALLPPATHASEPLPDIRDAYGVAISDFNRDGHLDLYLVGFRTLNRLLLNQGNGNFVDRSITSGAGGNLMPQGIRNLELGAGAADYDNDRSVDLLICGWGDAFDLLKNRGDGSFYSVTQKVGLERNAGANMGIWGDLDADGYLELLVTNEHGPMRLYHNRNGLRFTPIPLDSCGLAADTGSQGALWADLDLDGDLDLVVTGWHHPLRVYEQVSPMRFRKVDLGLPQPPPGARYNAVLPGDFDNDGDLDLLVTVRDGYNLLLENLADPPRNTKHPGSWEFAPRSIRFRECSWEKGLTDSLDSYGGAFRDYDSDGDMDLFLTAREGPNLYYENQGGHFRLRRPEEVGMKPSGNAYSTGFMAANLTPSPGFDLVIASRDSACTIESGPAALHPPTSVILNGVYSNPAGVGCHLSHWTQPKGKASGDGWSLKQSLQVHAGEGYLSSYAGPHALTITDTSLHHRIRVRFPSGKVVVRKVQPGDSTLVIWEAGFLGAAWQRGKQALVHGFQDPSRRKAVLTYALLLVLLILAMRILLKIMARNIARKHYTRELEHKNRELRELVDEVNRTQQQLIQSEKLAGLGQLVAGIAHELNNPIGFIYANLHQIKKYLERLDQASLNEDSRLLFSKMNQALQESQEGSTRIRDIVQNLRGISRSGKTAPGRAVSKKPGDLGSLLDKSLLLAQTNYSKNIIVDKEYAPLPLVPVDETQIQQVFLNILVNAGQALGEGGRLSLRTGREDGFAIVSIVDDGPGIGKDDVGKIFDPFFTTKPVGQGIGLGLHISYEIIKAHQGLIEVESTTGKGTRFTIKLPYLVESSAPAMPPSESTGKTREEKP